MGRFLAWQPCTGTLSAPGKPPPKPNKPSGPIQGFNRWRVGTATLVRGLGCAPSSFFFLGRATRGLTYYLSLVAPPGDAALQREAHHPYSQRTVTLRCLPRPVCCTRGTSYRHIQPPTATSWPASPRPGAAMTLGLLPGPGRRDVRPVPVDISLRLVRRSFPRPAPGPLRLGDGILQAGHIQHATLSPSAAGSARQHDIMSGHTAGASTSRCAAAAAARATQRYLGTRSKPFGSA